MAIIDYLQEWSIPKRFENGVKVFYDKKNRDKISAVHPRRYQERFGEFMSKNVLMPAYENYKASAGYVETCERFIESLIARVRVYELQQAGVSMLSVAKSPGQYDLPEARVSSYNSALHLEMVDDM